jgi:hypothetical protein
MKPRVSREAESKELLAPKPSMTLADDRASGDVDCGKQRRRAVAAVIVRAAAAPNVMGRTGAVRSSARI